MKRNEKIIIRELMLVVREGIEALEADLERQRTRIAALEAENERKDSKVRRLRSMIEQARVALHPGGYLAVWSETADAAGGWADRIADLRESEWSVTVYFRSEGVFVDASRRISDTDWESHRTDRHPTIAAALTEMRRKIGGES